MIDLGTFEEIGYADVIHTGKSKEEVLRILRKNAKKLGITLKINHVPRHPVGSVVLDTRTKRVALSGFESHLSHWKE